MAISRSIKQNLSYETAGKQIPEKEISLNTMIICIHLQINRTAYK